jgi:hypothetical protein
MTRLLISSAYGFSSIAVPSVSSRPRTSFRAFCGVCMSAKPHDDVQRVTAILKRLTRDIQRMPPTAKRELHKRIDVWLDELLRLR